MTDLGVQYLVSSLRILCNSAQYIKSLGFHWPSKTTKLSRKSCRKIEQKYKEQNTKANKQKQDLKNGKGRKLYRDVSEITVSGKTGIIIKNVLKRQ